MATWTDVERDIRAAYTNYRQDWYGSSAPAPAALQIAVGSLTSGYLKDTIYIYVGDGDVTDWEFKRNMTNVAWRRELIHEMLHEHQDKLVKAPSIEGKMLFAKRPSAFSGPGHDEKFHTAIADIAPYFKLTPEEFLDRVC